MGLCRPQRAVSSIKYPSPLARNTLESRLICFHYSGMARIFTAAPGLVKLMAGLSWADTRLPEAFEITPARVEKLKGMEKEGVVRSRL